MAQATCCTVAFLGSVSIFYRVNGRLLLKGFGVFTANLHAFLARLSKIPPNQIYGAINFFKIEYRFDGQKIEGISLGKSVNTGHRQTFQLAVNIPILDSMIFFSNSCLASLAKS